MFTDQDLAAAFISALVAGAICSAPSQAQNAKSVRPPQRAFAVPAKKNATPGAIKQPALQAEQPIKDTNAAISAKDEVENYLSTMRGLIQRYDNIILNLVGPGGTKEEGQEDCRLNAAASEQLEQDLDKLKAPPEVATEQGGLAESLTLVQDFFQSGGVQKHGFHGALDLTKQMNRISEQYHGAVLAMIKAHGLSLARDPFIDNRALRAGVFVPPMKIQRKKLTAGNTDDSSLLPTTGGPSGISSAAKSMATPSSSLIDGVDGSLGMSGLFNGLGGTDTNGLVDGLGLTTGLNGLVNGAAMGSSMSGMLNDTSTSTQSGDGF